MNRIARSTLFAIFAIALSGCLGMGAAELKAKADTSSKGEIALQLLKEGNRHIEKCDRTYAWPFTASIVCRAPTDADTIARIVREEVAKALAAPPVNP